MKGMGSATSLPRELECQSGVKGVGSAARKCRRGDAAVEEGQCWEGCMLGLERYSTRCTEASVLMDVWGQALCKCSARHGRQGKPVNLLHPCAGEEH